LVLHLDKVTVFAELRQIEVTNRDTELRQADEFLPVQTCGIGKDSTPVDDGNRLVRAEQDFV